MLVACQQPGLVLTNHLAPTSTATLNCDPNPNSSELSVEAILRCESRSAHVLAPLLPVSDRYAGPRSDPTWNERYEALVRQYAKRSWLPLPDQALATMSETELWCLWQQNEQQACSSPEPGTRQVTDHGVDRRVAGRAAPAPRESSRRSVAPWRSDHTAVSSGRFSAEGRKSTNRLYVRGYVRADGSYVPARLRSSRPVLLSRYVWRNESYYGQLNKYGRPKTVRVRGYFRKDGTHVRGHYRSSPRR